MADVKMNKTREKPKRRNKKRTQEGRDEEKFGLAHNF